MKVNLSKLLISFLCAIIFLSVFALPSYAEAGPVVTVNATSTAVPGDTVAVNVDMSENPGIMAMTFTVSYDSDALTFNKYTMGRWNDYTIVDHADKGYVSFVNCEIKNRKYNGTIFTLYFTVNDTAAPGVHHFKIMNIDPSKYGEDLKGCFANKEHTTVTATINNGSITIGKTCSNSRHTFGKYETTVKPTCIATGLEARTCSVCGHTETKELKKTEHSFEKDWTVDTAATKEQTGIMSRHCQNCSEVTDKVYYSLEESEENELKNEEDSSISSNDWEKLEEIEKENEEREKEEAKKENEKADSSEEKEENLSFFEKIGRFFAKIGSFFANIFKAIANFFKNLFK